MKSEEAKRILDQHYMLFNEEVKKALDCAIKAIDKQIPKTSEEIHPRVIIESMDGEYTTHRGLTLEELKAEAKRQGYVIVKQNNHVPHLPCTCGKKPSVWYYEPYFYIQCSHCNQRGMLGENINDAWRYWNIEVCK